MSHLRRVVVALAVVLAGFGSAGVVIVATATPGAALPCSDSWTGPTTGTTLWTANPTADWSAHAAPGSGDVACIDAAGTYTVELTASASVGALQVGGAASGTQTVTVRRGGGAADLSQGAATTVESGGTLTFESGASGNGDLSGAGSVTVASGGTLTTEGASQQRRHPDAGDQPVRRDGDHRGGRHRSRTTPP